MCNGYFEIRLVRASKQKGENKNTNPKPSNNNTKVPGGWYKSDFRVIPLPTRATRARARKGWPTQTPTGAWAWVLTTTELSFKHTSSKEYIFVLIF